jgi:uncharacterized membrane protein
MRVPGQLLEGLVLGAGAMYLLDPDRGRRRRALLRDQGVHAWHKTEDGLGTVGRDLRNRSSGVAARLRSRLKSDHPDDEVQEERARARRPRRSELLQENWSPTARVLAGTVGAAALARGLVSGGTAGAAAGVLGAGLLLRAATNLPLKRLIGIGAGRRAIDLQKTIHVAAPLESVWQLWSNFENFPRFMSHLREVRQTGERLSHWTAVGPAGIPVEWDAEITEWKPREEIAWKSVEGSVVGNAGAVRFRPGPNETTEIDIRLSYNPPAGAIGHGVASLLGSNLKQFMEDDLVRLKSLLEEGRTSTDDGQVRLEELPGGPGVKGKAPR